MEPPSQLPTCLTICIAHQKDIRWLLVVLICSVLILWCILIEATAPWKPPPHRWHCPMEATTPWKALPHGSNRKWSSWFWYCCARALLLLASDCTLVSGSYIQTYDLKPKIRVFRKSRSVFAQSRMFLETSRRSCLCSIICSFSTHFADTHRKAKFSSQDGVYWNYVYTHIVCKFFNGDIMILHDQNLHLDSDRNISPCWVPTRL